LVSLPTLNYDARSTINQKGKLPLPRDVISLSYIMRPCEFDVMYHVVLSTMRSTYLAVSITLLTLSVGFFYAHLENCRKRLLATASLSVRLTVFRKEQLGSHSKNFHEILYLKVF